MTICMEVTGTGSSMWLPQGGALKIENSQFTQYSIIMFPSSMLPYKWFFPRGAIFANFAF